MKVTIKRGQESMSSLPYLLSVALIVPTLLLLWFMFRTTQVEEKLMQDNLMRAYENQLQSGVAAWQALMIGSLPTPLVSEASSSLDQGNESFDTCLIFNNTFDLVYPKSIESSIPKVINSGSSFYLEQAGNFDAAAKSYLLDIQSEDNFEQSLNSWTGYLRTLHKSADSSAFDAAAIHFIQTAKEAPALMNSPAQPQLLGNLLFLLDNTSSGEVYQAAIPLLVTLCEPDDASHFSVSSPALAFFAPAIVQKLEGNLEDSHELQLIRQWSERQVLLREQYQYIRDIISSAPKDSILWRPLSGMKFHFTSKVSNSHTYVYIIDDASLGQSLLQSLDESGENASQLSILFDSEDLPPETGVHILTSLDEQIPGWRLMMSIDSNSALGGSHGRQRWFMLITGSLVILFILFIGSWVLSSLSRQIRLNRLKNDFIGTVTHELKTPLASTRLLVDTLIDSPLENKERIRRYLEQISRSNERLSVLIDNFLTFSRMERGKVQLSYDAVDPVDIGKQALESVQPYLEEAQCQFTFKTADNLPSCRANAEALITVIVNFLSNACKYSEADKRIELSIFEQGDFIHFSVADHGLGIPRHLQKRIFDRFYQIDRKLSRKAEGSGLGLSIVKYLIDAHQGKVFVESNPGEGSTFTAAIPKA